MLTSLQPHFTSQQHRAFYVESSQKLKTLQSKIESNPDLSLRLVAESQEKPGKTRYQLVTEDYVTTQEQADSLAKQLKMLSGFKWITAPSLRKQANIKIADKAYVSTNSQFGTYSVLPAGYHI